MIFTVQPSDECDGPPPSWSGEVWGGGEEEGVIFRVATCSCVSVCQCDVECVCVCMCDCSETSFMTLSHTSVHVEIWWYNGEKKRKWVCSRLLPLLQRLWRCRSCGGERGEVCALCVLTCVSDGWDKIQAHFCTSVLSLPASLSSWFFHLWAKWCFEVC